MKALLFLSLMTISFSSFACPELKGTYDCGNYKQTIEQYNEDGADIYILQSSPVSEFITADGLERLVEDTTVKARCDESQLVIEYTYGIIKSTERYYLNAEGNLVNKTVNIVIPKKTTCKKI